MEELQKKKKKKDFDLQIVSDIHLESRTSVPKIEQHAENIALLGDIGNVIQKRDLEMYQELLTDLKARFKRVFLVAGNHEYYGKSGTFDQCHQILKGLAEELGVIFLEKDEYHLPAEDSNELPTEDSNELPDGDSNIVILGTTLWTAGREKLKPSMNDYHQIKIGKKQLLTYEDTFRFHQENVSWLKEKLEQYEEKRIIILTHHAPLLDKRISAHPPDQFRIFFGSDLSDLMKPNVKIWAFGHTHHHADFFFVGRSGDRTRIVTNAMGHRHEETRYQEDFVVSLPL
jgi:predicted MPP superfamily phosphohydrolase